MNATNMTNTLAESDKHYENVRIQRVINLIMLFPERRFEILLNCFIETAKSLEESEKLNIKLLSNTIIPSKNFFERS